MRKELTILVLAAVVSVISAPLFAHHGNAAYDPNKKITVSGTVTEFIWANPHCWLKFDAKGEKGDVQHWIVEASNPPDQTRAGWAHDSFKPGDQVTVTIIPVKNGRTIGRFVGANQGGKIILNGKPFPPNTGDASGDGPATPKP